MSTPGTAENPPQRLLGLSAGTLGGVRGDHTAYSTVLLCTCGARFLGNSRDDATWQLDRHVALNGCAARRRHR